MPKSKFHHKSIYVVDTHFTCQKRFLFSVVIASLVLLMAVPVARLSEAAPAVVTSEGLEFDVAANVVPHVRNLSCGLATFVTH